MNAGKSTHLLQTSHNYVERGTRTLLYTSQHHTGADDHRIVWRLGVSAPARVYTESTDLFRNISRSHTRTPIGCVLVDEAQFLSKAQVWQLARVADQLRIKVHCYGLRTDFRGQLFEGSAALLAIADRLQEIRSVCHCGRKAMMSIRRNRRGAVLRTGSQVHVNRDAYDSLCRLHWQAEFNGSPKR